MAGRGVQTPEDYILCLYADELALDTDFFRASSNYNGVGLDCRAESCKFDFYYQGMALCSSLCTLDDTAFGLDELCEPVELFYLGVKLTEPWKNLAKTRMTAY